MNLLLSVTDFWVLKNKNCWLLYSLQLRSILSVFFHHLSAKPDTTFCRPFVSFACWRPQRSGGRIYLIGEVSGAGYLFCLARQSPIAVTVRVTHSQSSNWEIQPPKTKRQLVTIWAILTMLTSVTSASRAAVPIVRVKCVSVPIKRDTCSSKIRDRELLEWNNL